MNIVAWIVLGLLAGAIAKALYPGHQGGNILTTIILGIIGSLVGGTLFHFINYGNFALTSTAFSIPGLFVAVLGAMLVIFLYYKFAARAV